MKLLITGSGGLVGSAVVQRLKTSGHTLLTPKRAELNLLNQLDVQNYLETHKPDFIIHCAGRVGGIRANINHPVDFLWENLQMGLNIVTAAKAAGVRNLLNLGSSCMYPRNCKNPMTEDLVLTGELEPTNEGYALAKIAVARLCQYIRKESPEFLYKTAIPSNIYGPNDNFEAETAHLVPAAIRKVYLAHKEGAKNVTIWGDGTARREFMYSDDLADFIAYAIDNFTRMPDLLNVGPGVDHSINDYYQAVIDLVGYRGQMHHDLDKPTGMKQKLIDTTRLQQFGWSTRTNLRDGLKNTLDYFKTII